MGIEFKVNHLVTTDQFLELLNTSTLGERRPVDDLECIDGMLKNSNLIITAWDGNRLVGIARCMTDFHYACYLSDLAVSGSYQKQGIGKQLQVVVRSQLGPRCKLILISAPAANSYYEHIGFSHNDRCWVLESDSEFVGV